MKYNGFSFYFACPGQFIPYLQVDICGYKIYIFAKIFFQEGSY